MMRMTRMSEEEGEKKGGGIGVVVSLWLVCLGSYVVFFFVFLG